MAFHPLLSGYLPIGHLVFHDDLNILTHGTQVFGTVALHQFLFFLAQGEPLWEQVTLSGNFSHNLACQKDDILPLWHVQHAQSDIWNEEVLTPVQGHWLSAPNAHNPH